MHPPAGLFSCHEGHVCAAQCPSGMHMKFAPAGLRSRASACTLAYTCCMQYHLAVYMSAVSLPGTSQSTDRLLMHDGMVTASDTWKLPGHAACAARSLCQHLHGHALLCGQPCKSLSVRCRVVGLAQGSKGGSELPPSTCGVLSARDIASCGCSYVWCRGLPCRCWSYFAWSEHMVLVFALCCGCLQSCSLPAAGHLSTPGIAQLASTQIWGI